MQSTARQCPQSSVSDSTDAGSKWSHKLIWRLLRPLTPITAVTLVWLFRRQQTCQRWKQTLSSCHQTQSRSVIDRVVNASVRRPRTLVALILSNFAMARLTSASTTTMKLRVCSLIRTMAYPASIRLLESMDWLRASTQPPTMIQERSGRTPSEIHAKNTLSKNGVSRTAPPASQDRQRGGTSLAHCNTVACVVGDWSMRPLT